MNSTNENIIQLLRSGAKASPDLAQALGDSASTVLRSLRSLERERRVVRMGKTRGARYALCRTIDTIGSDWPIYRVDETGAVHTLGELEAIESNSYYVTAGPARIQGL